ncbi:glycosyltransferase [Arthrobacter sp. 2MCAF15]|uniref:glycosyltransferase n=1 Tax=Arthrobacter sp. 2MCAF15 TaxID=3232984 RepID=UPI003F91B955
MKNSTHVAAVVVSYNRIQTLKKVIHGLQQQTRPVDKIIIVDNGSTDGSRELVQSLGGNVALVASSTNGGGAGGFAKGIAWSAALNFDYVWLMDDDAVPDNNSLELLLQPFGMDFPRPISFTCPRVNDAAGDVGPRNFPLVSRNFDEVYPSVENGLLPVKAATFVGPLISIEVAKKTHLPLEDFFIWHDDIEYTARLEQFGVAFSVPQAQITHFVTNIGPQHYNAGRNFFNIRNLIWWMKETRLNGTYDSKVIFRQLRGAVKSQFLAAPNKLAFLWILLKAVWVGSVRSPRHRNFEELIVESRLRDSLYSIYTEDVRPSLG